MSLLTKIHYVYDALSSNEQKIADFVLANLQQAANCSSQRLAEHIGVSQSAIIKFSQKLGIKRFGEFKLALNEDWVKQSQTNTVIHLHDNITAQDDIQLIAQKLFLEKQRALQDSLELNSPKIIKKVIEHMLTAKRIQLLGLGNSALVAKDLCYKLTKIGLPVVSEMDSHAQLAISQSLRGGDLLLVISFSGKHREILLSAQAAKENGASVVAITTFIPNPLHQIANHLLYSVADESQFRSSSIASRTAQHAITDLLFMGIMQQQPESHQLILNSNEWIGRLEK